MPIVLALVTAGCATASPPPSALANGRWWDGQAFVSGTRWVRDDHFVAQPKVASEEIDLGGSFVMPAAGNACGLAPPCRADARLTAGDPRQPGARVVMDLVGGRPAGPPSE